MQAIEGPMSENNSHVDIYSMSESQLTEAIEKAQERLEAATKNSAELQRTLDSTQRQTEALKAMNASTRRATMDAVVRAHLQVKEAQRAMAEFRDNVWPKAQANITEKRSQLSRIQAEKKVLEEQLQAAEAGLSDGDNDERLADVRRKAAESARQLAELEDEVARVQLECNQLREKRRAMQIKEDDAFAAYSECIEVMADTFSPVDQRRVREELENIEHRRRSAAASAQKKTGVKTIENIVDSPTYRVGANKENDAAEQSKRSSTVRAIPLLAARTPSKRGGADSIRLLGDSDDSESDEESDDNAADDEDQIMFV